MKCWRRASRKSKRAADRSCYTGVATPPWEDGYEPYDKSKAKDISLHPDPSSEEAKLVPWVVLPFVRVPSTDLNMTLSIALIAFVMIQYIGFKALGHRLSDQILQLLDALQIALGRH